MNDSALTKTCGIIVDKLRKTHLAIVEDYCFPISLSKNKTDWRKFITCFVFQIDKKIGGTHMMYFYAK